MAQETRVQLYAKILANLPDNTTEQITPATDREVENAEVESCFNLLDDDATDVNYNPTTTADWDSTVPDEVGEGLDELAERVKMLEGATVSPTSISFNVNSDSTVSFPYVESEPITIDTSSEAISQTLSNAYYQVSTDAENWVDAFSPPAVGNATITDLANYVSNITSGTVFSIRAIGVFKSTKTGEASIKFNFIY